MSISPLVRKISLVVISLAVVGISATLFVTSQTGPKYVEVDGLLENWGPQDMAKRAKYVLTGTVKDLIISSVDADPTRWNKPMVYTDVVINVDGDLANQYNDSQITVRTLGGKTDKYWIESSISPKFEKGEKVLIFVSKEPGSEMGDNYFVLAQKLGKYKLDNGKAFGKDHEQGIDQVELITQIQSALKDTKKQ